MLTSKKVVETKLLLSFLLATSLVEPTVSQQVQKNPLTSFIHRLHRFGFRWHWLSLQQVAVVCKPNSAKRRRDSSLTNGLTCPSKPGIIYFWTVRLIQFNVLAYNVIN